MEKNLAEAADGSGRDHDLPHAVADAEAGK
jgi:hypothetical protein